MREAAPGEFSLTLATGANPPQTSYSVAVVDVATQEILTWVNPATGLPVKTDEDRWASVVAESDSEDGTSEAVVVARDLGLDPDLIGFAVQAKNQSGDETLISEAVVPVQPDLLSGDGSGSAGEADVQVAVPTNAPVPVENKIASTRDEVRELRAKIKKLKAERSELRRSLKKLNAEHKKIAKEKKDQEKDKEHGKKADEKAGKNQHGNETSDWAKNQDDIAGIKAKSEKLKSEIKSLQKLLTQKTAALKELKKVQQSQKVSRKS